MTDPPPPGAGRRRPGLHDRQLRLVHLQPRPVPRRARRRHHGQAQRPRDHRGDRRGAARPTSSSPPAPARPTRPASAWTPSRTSAPRACRCSASASATRPSARCTAAWCAAPARPVHGKTDQIHHDGARRVRRPARPVHGHPLPLAGRRRGAAGLPRAHRLERRGRRDGRAPPRAAGARRAVPPRERAHRGGARPAGDVPAHDRREGGAEATPRGAPPHVEEAGHAE